MALISFAVTAKLICIFVFAYAKSRFSHVAPHIKTSSNRLTGKNTALMYSLEPLTGVERYALYVSTGMMSGWRFLAIFSGRQPEVKQLSSSVPDISFSV